MSVCDPSSPVSPNAVDLFHIIGTFPETCTFRIQTHMASKSSSENSRGSLVRQNSISEDEAQKKRQVFSSGYGTGQESNESVKTQTSHEIDDHVFEEETSRNPKLQTPQNGHVFDEDIHLPNLSILHNRSINDSDSSKSTDTVQNSSRTEFSHFREENHLLPNPSLISGAFTIKDTCTHASADQSGKSNTVGETDHQKPVNFYGVEQPNSIVQDSCDSDASVLISNSCVDKASWEHLNELERMQLKILMEQRHDSSPKSASSKYVISPCGKESRNLSEDISQVSCFNFAELIASKSPDSLAEIPPKSIQTDHDMNYMSRCQECFCKDPHCIQLKKHLISIKHALCYEVAFDFVEKDFEKLYKHSSNCFVPQYKCMVPWCHYLWKKKTENCVDIYRYLQDAVSTPILSLSDLFEDDFYGAKCTILDYNSPINKLPSNEVIAIVSFGMFGNVIMISPQIGSSEVNLVVKKINVENQDTNTSCASVLRALSNKSHDNIVKNFCMYEAQANIYVCSECIIGEDLQNHLKRKQFLCKNEAMKVFTQLLKAATFLHKNKIVYLYWTACNVMLVNTSLDHVKLTNFSMSTMENSEYDAGHLKMCLPPCIIPSELINEGNLEKHTDSWGLSCLLAYMMTGKQMWYSLRHKTKEEIFNKVRDRKLPMEEEDKKTLNKENPKIFSLLKDCWSLLPESRPTASKMLKMLNNMEPPIMDS